MKFVIQRVKNASVTVDNKIVGSINKSGYRYINISMVCSCGNYGSLEIRRPDAEVDLLERIKKRFLNMV